VYGIIWAVYMCVFVCVYISICTHICVYKRDISLELHLYCYRLDVV